MMAPPTHPTPFSSGKLAPHATLQSGRPCFALTPSRSPLSLLCPVCWGTMAVKGSLLSPRHERERGWTLAPAPLSRAPRKAARAAAGRGEGRGALDDATPRARRSLAEAA